MLFSVDVNYIAILVAAVTNMIIGSLWYGPLFGKTWMKLSKISKKKLAAMKKKNMTKIYFFAFLASLVTAYILGMLIEYTGATTMWNGIVVGFWVWLGFIVTETIGGVLWEGKSMKMFLFKVISSLVPLAVMGIILAVW